MARRSLLPRSPARPDSGHVLSSRLVTWVPASADLFSNNNLFLSLFLPPRPARELDEVSGDSELLWQALSTEARLIFRDAYRVHLFL